MLLSVRLLLPSYWGKFLCCRSDRLFTSRSESLLPSSPALTVICSNYFAWHAKVSRREKEETLEREREGDHLLLTFSQTANIMYCRGGAEITQHDFPCILCVRFNPFDQKTVQAAAVIKFPQNGEVEERTKKNNGDA